MTPESKVRTPVVEWAKVNGIEHIRLALMRGVKRGTPDDLFLISWRVRKGSPARAVFIEFKRPGKKPTRLQYERLSQLQNRGFFAEWFDNADDAISYLAWCADVGTASLSAKGGGFLIPTPRRGASAETRRAKNVDHA